MKKKITTTLLVLTFTLASTLTSLAGWEQPAPSEWKYSINNTYYTNGWYWIDGNNDLIAECYYFNENGMMLSSTQTPDNYTVNAEGQWTVNGVVQTKTLTQETQPEVQPQQQLGGNGFIPGTNIPSTGDPALDAQLAESYQGVSIDFGGDGGDNWVNPAPDVTIH